MPERSRWLSRRTTKAMLTIVGIFIVVLLVSAWWSTQGRLHPRRQMPVSRQARAIVEGCYRYAQEPSNPHPHHFPKELGELLRRGYVAPGTLISPFVDRSVPSDLMHGPVSRQDAWVHKNSSFVLIPDQMDHIDEREVTLFLKPKDSVGKGISVCFNDNHAEWISLAEAKKLIEAQTGKTIQQLVAASERSE